MRGGWDISIGGIKFKKHKNIKNPNSANYKINLELGTTILSANALVSSEITTIEAHNNPYTKYDKLNW